jgi:hypothetical protein
MKLNLRDIWLIRELKKTKTRGRVSQKKMFSISTLKISPLHPRIDADLKSLLTLLLLRFLANMHKKTCILLKETSYYLCMRKLNKGRRTQKILS